MSATSSPDYRSVFSPCVGASSSNAPVLVVSNVYVSDHSKEVMAALCKRVAEQAEKKRKGTISEADGKDGKDCFVAWTFHDVEYNRSSMCISGKPEAVVDAVLAVVLFRFETLWPDALF